MNWRRRKRRVLLCMDDTKNSRVFRNSQYHNSRFLFFPATITTTTTINTTTNIIILDFVVIVEKYCDGTIIVCTSFAPSRSSPSMSSLTPGGIVSCDDHENIVRMKLEIKYNNDNRKKNEYY